MLMLKKDLGKSGLRIPPVVFGTSALGNLYTAPVDEVKRAIIRECSLHVKSPVVFDCAGKYGAGMALEMLGNILRQLNIHPSGVIISNKLGWKQTPLKTPEPTFEKGVWVDIRHDARQEISYEGIMACWEQGNQLLGRGYQPQMLSVHDPDEYLAASENEGDRARRFEDILQAYRALIDLKKSGKVRAVGVGAKDWRIIQQISEKIALDWVMLANSLTIFRHPAELCSFVEALNRQGIGIINSAVFHAGFMTGGRFFDYRPIRPDSPENKRIFRWREDFFTLCQRHKIEPAVACIHFAMTPPGVTALSLNTSDPGRIKGNVESVTAKVPEDFYAEMKKKGLISREYPFLGI